MKHVYLSLLLAMTAVVFLFKFQNLDTVTVQFLSASLTLPLSLLLLAVYVLGMLTGGMLLSMVRSWVRGGHLETSLEQLSHGDFAAMTFLARGGAPGLGCRLHPRARCVARHCAWVCRRWWWVSRWWLLAPVHRRWP